MPIINLLPGQLDQIKLHMEIAEFAHKKLDAVGVKSANKVWNKNKDKRNELLSAQRKLEIDWHDLADHTAHCEKSKIGNCWEKATMFAHYSTQHPKFHKTNVYRCGCDGWDHNWSVLTTMPLTVGKTYDKLSALGTTACIIDG